MLSAHRTALQPWRHPRSGCRSALALYNRREHHPLAFLYGGHDPGVCCRDFGAFILWLRGYSDQAWQRSQEALILARELSHPFSLAEALGYAAWLCQFRREVKAVRQLAEAVMALAQAEGFRYWSAQGQILWGWGLTQQGQGDKGIAEMRQGLADHRATGSEAARPYYLALLAEAYGKMARPVEGLNILREALETVHTTEAGFYEAELHRLKGELLLMHAAATDGSQAVAAQEAPPARIEEPVWTEAEACFRGAIDIARRQQAKSWELRAAMSLSRLWQRQGKPDAAYALSAEIYRWFTEGHETTDLQEVKARLDELGASVRR